MILQTRFIFKPNRKYELSILFIDESNRIVDIIDIIHLDQDNHIIDNKTIGWFLKQS